MGGMPLANWTQRVSFTDDFNRWVILSALRRCGACRLLESSSNDSVGRSHPTRRYPPEANGYIFRTEAVARAHVAAPGRGPLHGGPIPFAKSPGGGPLSFSGGARTAPRSSPEGRVFTRHHK